MGMTPAERFRKRATVARIFLLEGPLMQAPERRETLVARMVADLIAYGAPADRQDAVSLLHSLGYTAMEIHVVIDDVHQAAMQEMVVAAEMSKP
jgi:hypothetical protein